MKPEDVKPRDGKFSATISINPYTTGPKIWPVSWEIGPYIPAHEVGAIIKAAMEDAIWLTEHAYEAWHTPEERAKSNAAYSAWLAKAEELERMK